MINLAAFNKQSINTFFCILISTIVLQGCGGQRDEPFKPTIIVPCSSSSSNSSSTTDSSSSSNSSSSASSCSNSRSSSSSNSSAITNSSVSSIASSSAIELMLIGSGTQTNTVIEITEKNVQVMKNATDFMNISGAYSTVNLDSQDFDAGQVILIDDGNVNNCDAHLAFNSNLSAETVGNNSLKVIIDYLEKPAVSPCAPSSSRPYYFYYIKSRKLLTFEDKIIVGL